MKKVSGYSTRKASKVGADTVLAGRRVHSLTVLGKEFDSIWSLIRSWKSLCCPLVRASPLWRNLSALMSTRLLYIMESRLCFRRCTRGIPVQFFKHVGGTLWGLRRIVVENKTSRSALNLFNSVDMV